MFIKWLKLKRKSKSEQNPDPEPEPKSALRPPPITSMMVPEPGAVIGGKRRK